MDAITECTKCLPRGAKQVLTVDAVCDLAPMRGFRGPCALKFERGILDEDDGEDGSSVPSATRARRKARPNARKRAEDKSGKRNVDTR